MLAGRHATPVRDPYIPEAKSGHVSLITLLQAAQTLIFMSSAALVENGWRDLKRRGVEVTATREENWQWWSPNHTVEQVQEGS